MLGLHAAGWVGEEVAGLILVYIGRNLTLNSDAILNYKYTFTLHRGTLHLL